MSLSIINLLMLAVIILVVFSSNCFTFWLQHFYRLFNELNLWLQKVESASSEDESDEEKSEKSSKVEKEDEKPVKAPTKTETKVRKILDL